MFKQPKVIITVAFMLLSVIVDFTSTLLSMVSDAILIGTALYFMLTKSK